MMSIKPFMCFSVFASATAFGFGMAGCLVAHFMIERRKLEERLRRLYTYAILAWAFAVCMQLADLTSWLAIDNGGEKSWNGPLSYGLNIGQIFAMLAAFGLGTESMPPAVAISAFAYTIAALYTGATTKLTVSPRRPGGRLVYSWWSGNKGLAFGALYVATMGAIIYYLPDPLRGATFASTGLTLVISMVAERLYGSHSETGSVWCWLAAIIGPASLMFAASQEPR